MKIIKQAVKYGIVGVGNTLLSLIIIRIMTRGGCSETFSNLTGYVVGLINSFLWNKLWTFQSGAGWRRSALRFFGVFVVCYLLQLGLLVLLNRYCPDSPPLYSFFRPLLQAFKVDTLFYIQIITMLFYTVINFVINKFYTFKS